MFEIIVNNAFKTYGLISINVRKEGGKLVAEGVLKTHLYIEEIDTLECDRFIVGGVDVVSETFGSTDPFIEYYFTFTKYDTFYEELEYEQEELLKLYEKENE